MEEVKRLLKELTGGDAKLIVRAMNKDSHLLVRVTDERFTLMRKNPEYASILSKINRVMRSEHVTYKDVRLHYIRVEIEDQIAEEEVKWQD